ncbi:MAG: Hpt domain-containing protein, partial [Sedimenticola sp.]
MSSDELSYEEQLVQLQREYIAELPERIREVERAWNAYSSDDYAPGRLKALHHPIHRIAGSAATFGLANLSELARTVEMNLKQLINSGNQPTDIECRNLAKQIGKLLNSTARQEQKAALVIGSKPASMPASEQPLIYLLEDDRQFAEGLALQLGNYGYRIELFTETSSIERA